MPRELLPDRRAQFTQKVKLRDAHGKPQTYYVSFGEYEDGRLGEVFITAAKEGTFVRGILDTLAREVSQNLQHGTPPAEVARSLRGMEFPPNGEVVGDGAVVETCTSLADYVASEIEVVYVRHRADVYARHESATRATLSPAAEPPPEKVAGYYEGKCSGF